MSAIGAHESAWSSSMHIALQHARDAAQRGEVPVGAVVVDPVGNIVGAGANTRESDGDPLAHAEVVALRAAAAALGTWRLDDCTLVVTLEPCTMCAGAVVQSRVCRLVFGAHDEKA
ncbi:MAG: nucleoside deaminase, partial [Actinobacteria bacterium]|nr:nucleoside deaminase [Actinomycetota bacterium]